MSEQQLLEYIANSIWQVPMLAVMAWALVRLGKPTVQIQHRVWLLTLALSVLLPMARWKALPGMPSVNQGAIANAVTVVPALPSNGDDSSAFLDGKFAPSSRPQVSLPWWKSRTVPLSQTAVDLVMALYLLLIVWRLGQLAYGWSGAQKLLRNAWPRKLPPAVDAMLQQCCAKLRVREPRILTSDGIASPMTIGGIRPAILLPDVLDDTIASEMLAILCHELAHVRRCDYVGNWICQLGSLPIAYHPATYGVQQRIRQSRELVCDAMAADAMSSTTAYARCLVTLTQRVLERATPAPSVQGIGLFDHDVLEERIMQLLEKRISMSWRAKLMRAAGAVAVTTVTIAAATVFHVTPTIVHAEVRTVPPASTVSVATPVVAQVGAQAAPPATAANSSKPTTDKDSVAPPPPPAAPPAMDAAPPLPPPARMTGMHAAPAPPPVSPAAPDGMAVPPALRLPPDAQALTPPIAPIAPVPDADAHAHRHVHPHPHPHAHPHPHPNPHPHPQLEDPGTDSPQAENKQFRLTPEQRARMEADMARANTRIQQATARLRSPEFKRQMAQMQLQIADATKQMQNAEVQRQMKTLQSPEFKKQMADMQRQVADATKRMQSAEVQKQLKVLQGREFKQQMAEMQLKIDKATKQMQSTEVQRQMKMLQSPEFKKQMAEMQRDVQKAAKQLKNNSMRMDGNDVNPNSPPQKSQPETTTPAPQ